MTIDRARELNDREYINKEDYYMKPSQIIDFYDRSSIVEYLEEAIIENLFVRGFSEDATICINGDDTKEIELDEIPTSYIKEAFEKANKWLKLDSYPAQRTEIERSGSYMIVKYYLLAVKKHSIYDR